MAIKRKLFNDEIFTIHHEEINNQNFNTIRSLSKAGISVSIVLLMIVAFTRFQQSSFIIYATWLATYLVYFLCCKFTPEVIESHATMHIYIFVSILSITAIISGTYLSPNMNSVVVIGYMCIFPFIFLDCIGRFLIFEAAISICFCVMSLLTKDISIATLDCANSIGFLVLACVMGARNITVKLNAIEATAEIIRQRDTDMLTGLLTRRAAEEIVECWLNSAHELEERSAFVLIDLDHFKEINDNYGHHIGDKILYQVAQAIRSPFRRDDCVARLGGDEFLVFIPDIIDEQTILDKTQQSLDMLNDPIIIKDKSFKISATAGIAIGHKDERFKDLYKRADKAMYNAKEKQRGRLCVCDINECHVTTMKII